MIRHVIKLVALALIIFPEPVTTAIGVAMLATIAATSGRKRLSKFRNMQELLNRSLNRGETGWRISRQERAIIHTLMNSHEQEKIATLTAQPAYKGSFLLDNRRVSARVLHHTLKNSVIQYEAGPVVRVSSPLDVNEVKKAQVTEMHSLKITDFPTGSKKHIPSGDWKRNFYTPDEIILHTLKTTAAKS